MRILHFFITFIIVMGLCQSCKPRREVMKPSEAANFSERYLVVVHEAKQGYGNRIRSLASAYAMSRLTNRTLILDWEAVPNEVPATFNDLFLNKIKTPADMNLPANLTYSELKRAKGNPSLVSSYDFRYVQDNENHSDMINCLSKVIIVTSYFRFLPQGLAFEDIKPLYMKFINGLEPVEKVKEAVRQFTNAHFVERKHMVGVHFRSFTLTADISVPEKADSSYPKLVNKMDAALQRDPKAHFFVATDSKQHINQLKEKYGDRIITTDIDVERVTLNGQLEALVDWYLLGQTHYVIGTYQSSFSDEAALLTTTGKKIDFGTGYDQSNAPEIESTWPNFFSDVT